MKKLFTFLLILSFISTSAMAWPFSKKVPKQQTTAVAKPSPTPKPTISGGRELVREITNELKAAKEENSRLKLSLEKANKEVVRAQTQTTEVQKAADALKEWGIIQQAEAHKFIEKYNNAVKRYHRLKAIAAVVAAIAGALLGAQFMAMVPPPYNLGLPIGIAALLAALVWLFL